MSELDKFIKAWEDYQVRCVLDGVKPTVEPTDITQLAEMIRADLKALEKRLPPDDSILRSQYWRGIVAAHESKGSQKPTKKGRV